MALSAVKAKDIAEIRVLKEPPQSVKRVMHAVCILMQKQPERVIDPDGKPNARKDDWWLTS